MSGFSALMMSATHDGQGLSLDLPEAWAQGRTAFGGLSAALCVEAARLAHPTLPPLRSAQFAFSGPASGRLRARTTLVRQGRSAALVEAVLEGSDGKASQAFLTYGAPRQSAILHKRRPMPAVAAPETCAPFAPGDAGPRFFGNFDLRLAAGAFPFSGGAEPAMTFWGRHRNAEGADPLTALVAIADSLPPAAIAQIAKPAPLSTMTWSFDVFALGEPTDWYLLSAESDIAGDGYSSQAMTVWDRSGALLATGRQLVAIFEGVQRRE